MVDGTSDLTEHELNILYYVAILCKNVFLHNRSYCHTHITGCSTAFLMPHPSIGLGAARRSGPIGGWAKGIPKYCATILSDPFTFMYCPRTLPGFRTTTGSVNVSDSGWDVKINDASIDGCSLFQLV